MQFDLVHSRFDVCCLEQLASFENVEVGDSYTRPSVACLAISLGGLFCALVRELSYQSTSPTHYERGSPLLSRSVRFER